MAPMHASSILPFFSAIEASCVGDSSFWAKGSPQRCLAGVTLGSDQANLIVPSFSFNNLTAGVDTLSVDTLNVKTQTHQTG